MSLPLYLNRIVEQREVLSREDSRALLEAILAAHAEADVPGGPHTIQLAGLLTALATRGEAPTEIAGFVDAMRAAATPVPLDEAEQALLVDTCGTGADLSGTWLPPPPAPASWSPSTATVPSPPRAVPPTFWRPSASPSALAPPKEPPRCAAIASPSCTRLRCTRP